MHLLAAPMLLGLALASVPIIIHLLNRRRFRLVEWAPMKYLHLTIRTNRRRMRIEQLILLIVRTLVVALLFAALARPALSGNGMGGWLASRARTSRVIVIDDSLSTGYRTDHRPSFESAKEAAAQIVRATGAQDAVTVVLTSRPAEPLVREASLSDPSKLLSQLSTLAPVDGACDWATVFKHLDDVLNGAAHPQKELVVLTDLRRSGWAGDVARWTARWAGQSVGMNVVDVGARRTDNVMLARFEQEDPLALPGTPLKLRASIRNDTPVAVRGVQATLDVDGAARPVMLPDVPAGQAIDVPLSVTFETPGQHALRLALPGDALPADDVRWLAVSVRPNVTIALVDGQPGAGAFESSTDFLHVAFTVGAEPWRVTRTSDGEWQQRQQAALAQVRDADVIVLSNVASLSPQQVDELEKLVAAGAGLMIFGGDQLDSQAYDERLYRDGAGLLPARLERAIDEPANGLVVEGFEGSPLAPLTRIAPEALARIRPRRFLGVVQPSARDESVRVLARWNDAEAHPAVLEKRFGRGRVILWTLGADRAWSDWPVDPTYVLAMRSAAVAVARPDPAGDNFTAGQPIAHRVSDGEVARNPRVAAPDDPAAVPMSVDGQVLRHAHAHRAGRYVLTWRDARDAERTRTLAASFDVAESDLEPINDTELTLLLAPLVPTIVHWTSGGANVTEGGKEIWRSLIVAVLGLAMFETALAVWVGRER